MAQYDVLLTQNVSAAGIEFSEKYINLDKGGLLSAVATTKVPTVLAGGTDGYMLVRDDAEVTGLKWVARPTTDHTQNTDTGTTAASFAIDSDNATDGVLLKVGAGGLTIRNIGDTGADNLVVGAITCSGIGVTGTKIILDSDSYAIEVTAESATKAGVKVSGGATYADFQAKDATFAKVTVTAAPSAGSDLTNKTYVDGIMATADAMIFKGTVGTGGTHEIAAFNALATYNAGWTYKVITAGTIKGKVCEIGDLVTATVDRAGSGNLDADWVAMQTNIDGAVTGPSSATSANFASYNGTSGKVIDDSGYNYNDFLTVETFNAHSIIYSVEASTPLVLEIGASTVVGRGATGNIVALTPAQLANVLCVTAPATKTSTGIAGQIAFDANFIYRCTATNTWTRGVMCTNW